MKRADDVLIDHFRCPKEFVRLDVPEDLPGGAGFFKFGPDAVCFGKCSAFSPSPDAESSLGNAADYGKSDCGRVELPFDIAEAVRSLRCESYTSGPNDAARRGLFGRFAPSLYYAVRPALPVSVRKSLQRYYLRDWSNKKFPRWPVDTSVESAIETAMRLNLNAQGVKELPFIWFWPDGANACALMTHDVETAAGRDFCDQLMDMDDSYGIKASFQVVPEQRYVVTESYLRNIHERGFEVNVHDLNHDGRLFSSYEEFSRRSEGINAYARKFGSKGFRAGALYRNVEWFDLLDVEYDMSVPNVAHLDPQHGGCCTTFPFFVGEILEIPVTMTQDYSLFNILGSHSLSLWEEQMAIVLEKHGLINFIIHPDYILGEREQNVYKSLLGRLSELRRTAGVWLTLPAEVNEWWRQRSRMRLVRNGGGWKIVGEGSDRARIAYAHLEDEKLIYALESYTTDLSAVV